MGLVRQAMAGSPYFNRRQIMAEKSLAYFMRETAKK